VKDPGGKRGHTNLELEPFLLTRGILSWNRLGELGKKGSRRGEKRKRKEGESVRKKREGEGRVVCHKGGSNPSVNEGGR